MNRLNILDLETGKVREESQREMVLTAFKSLGEATDWEALNKIEEMYGIEIAERNWVSARRGDLMSEGLILDSGKKRLGEFGKGCVVWCFNADGKKEVKEFLSSNEMNRVVKYLNDKCRTANPFQLSQMIEIIEHYRCMKQ